MIEAVDMIVAAALELHVCLIQGFELRQIALAHHQHPDLLDVVPLRRLVRPCLFVGQAKDEGLLACWLTQILQHEVGRKIVEMWLLLRGQFVQTSRGGSRGKSGRTHKRFMIIDRLFLPNSLHRRKGLSSVVCSAACRNFSVVGVRDHILQLFLP